MAVDAPLRPRIRLTLVQLMKMVIFCAVASACVAPMFHLWRVGVAQARRWSCSRRSWCPWSWRGSHSSSYGRGPWKDDLIACLLLCSVSVALGFAVWLLVFYTIPAYSDPRVGPESRISLAGLMLHVTVILSLSWRISHPVGRSPARFVPELRRLLFGERPAPSVEAGPPTS